jgi:trimeric autotransporter adhesin
MTLSRVLHRGIELAALAAMAVPFPVRAQGIITTVAGSSWSFKGNGAPAVSASLGRLEGVLVQLDGTVFATDVDNCIVVKIALSGILNVVAGNGICGFSGDGGPATSASISSDLGEGGLGGFGLAVDSQGNLYLADTYNSRVRKINSQGTISTVAGKGFPGGFSGDGGPATLASLTLPTGLAVDAGDNLYIADSENNRIRKVTPDGTITTIAGSGPAATFGSFSGDGGQATSASLYFPESVVVDAVNNIYIADTYNTRIRKVTPNGIINTVAGTGRAVFSGDGGPAKSASLVDPVHVTLDSAGNLFIVDGQRLRKVGLNGIINTVAGNGCE